METYLVVEHDCDGTHYDGYCSELSARQEIAKRLDKFVSIRHLGKDQSVNGEESWIERGSIVPHRIELVKFMIHEMAVK